jgi:hypothetical protein
MNIFTCFVSSAALLAMSLDLGRCKAAQHLQYASVYALAVTPVCCAHCTLVTYTVYDAFILQ